MSSEKVGKLVLDTALCSNEDLAKALESIQQVQEERKQMDEKLIKLQFDHIDEVLSNQQINIGHTEALEDLEHEHVEPSLDHLELYQRFLERLPLEESSDLFAKHQKLRATTSKLISEHPTYGTARSGDIEGHEHKSAAILKTPIGRRRQTAAVIWLSLLTGPLLTNLFLFLLWMIIPFSTIFFLAYFTWLYYDTVTAPRPNYDRLSQRWRRNPVFRHFADYFPIRMFKSADKAVQLDPKENFLFCYHPHGVISAGVLAMATAATGFDELFPGLTLSVNTLPVNWYLPVSHEQVNFLAFGDASKASLKRALTSGPGRSALLVTGGAKESMAAQPHTSKVVLKTRAGFVKIALLTGASLVPMWGFGENNIFENLAADSPTILKWQRNIQKVISFAPVLVAGRGVFSYGGFGIVPHRRPISVVVGAPIPVEKDENPSKEKVEAIHAQYKAAVQELFNNYKDIYDPKAEPIEFI